MTASSAPDSPLANQPQPIRGDTGASILGPRNVPVESENPDLLASPQTDAGTIPNLKFSFAAARDCLLSGGWAREVTARELPVATTLAGANMRLKPGAIRELHFLEMFRSSYFADVSHLDKHAMAALRKDKPIIVRSEPQGR